MGGSSERAVRLVPDGIRFGSGDAGTSVAGGRSEASGPVPRLIPVTYRDPRTRNPKRPQSGLRFRNAIDLLCLLSVAMPVYSVKTGFSSQQASGALLVLFMLALLAGLSLAERIADWRRISMKHRMLSGRGIVLPSPPSLLTRLVRRLLLAQPLAPPNPVFGTALGNYEGLQLALILAANLVLMIVPVPYPTPDQVAAGAIWNVNAVSKRVAWVGCGNMFFILMSATRNSLLTVIANEPFERTLLWHRWIGYLVFFQFTLHSVLTFVHLSNTGKLSSEVQLPVNIFGIAAWICLVVLAMLSLPAVRRLRFRLFYYAHHLFLPFLLFGILHRPAFGWFSALGGVAWIGDRAIRFWRSWREANVLDAKVMPAGDGGETCSKLVVRSRAFDAGQYAFISIPGAGSRLDFHPLSASSAPDASGTMSFHVKASGDFTVALASSLSSERLRVYVDGFHGRPRIAFESYHTVILVAGGIGVSPMLSIAADIAARMGSPLGSGTLAWATRKVVLVWYVCTGDEAAWFEEELGKLLDAAGGAEENGCSVEARCYVTRAADGKMPAIAQPGRPAIGDVLVEIAAATPGALAIGVCGPSSLVRDVRNAGAKMAGDSSTKRDVGVHWESFEL
ncbi:ferric reductase like transmembrane component-domain-containing protein [Hyaloraphidium curvatum]|nr:ferric reductase like transmembrane component-domain-containing protein [Hyaloraphidium curvatum]